MIKKGIILAGGKGTRMSPLTKAVNKQLLPIYDKPLIFYPLSILMLAKIKDILIIVNKGQLNQFRKILPEKNNLGINILYKEQSKPRGLPDAFLIGEKFIGKDNVALILGDNFFYGQNFSSRLKKSVKLKNGAQVYLHPVNNPNLYGVATTNKKNKILKIVEKPKKTKSNLAVTGMYFFDNNVINLSKTLKPSKRNELEITDINNYYLKENNLKYFKIKPGGVWLDAGTEKSLLQSSLFIQTMQERQNIQISSPEIIAYNNGWISKKKLISSVSDINNSYTSFIKNS